MAWAKDLLHTVVVFRVWKDTGDVLALLPNERGTGDFATCNSYQHVGQHSSANYTQCIRATRPAKPAEYAALQRELESYPYGYNLQIRTRRPW